MNIFKLRVFVSVLRAKIDFLNVDSSDHTVTEPGAYTGSSTISFMLMQFRQVIGEIFKNGGFTELR
jgi:hypothetical protein